MVHEMSDGRKDEAELSSAAYDSITGTERRERVRLRRSVRACCLDVMLVDVFRTSRTVASEWRGLPCSIVELTVVGEDRFVMAVRKLLAAFRCWSCIFTLFQSPLR